MKKLLAAALAASILSSAAIADENIDSAVDWKWAFGLQAAPLLFGLSLRRELTDKWQVQGVLQPTGDNLSLGARVLRTATQKKFWKSYLFAGVAHNRDSSPGFFDDDDSDLKETALTTGLGVEWSWNARNESLPPLAWSLELGLGYSDFDDQFDDEDNELFLAVGAGIHYQFQ